MIKDNVIHIKYPTGEMNLVIDKFFPTTVERVKKVSRIIRDHVPVDEQKELYAALKNLVLFYRYEKERYEAEIEKATDNITYEEAFQNMKDCQKKREQLKRDIDAYVKTVKLEV
jgi:hypothetical protein